MKAKKGKKVDWAQIIYNSLCSEVDLWYKYIKENKGDKKNTYHSTLILAKILKYLFIHQKGNPQKLHAKVKKTRKYLQVALESRRKVATESPKNVLKRKNKVEEGEATGSGVKKEQESIKT
jgi:hypothetical protein